MLNLLELELQVDLSCQLYSLETGPSSSTRTICALTAEPPLQALEAHLKI